MKISYSITTHNETDSLLNLIHFIMEHKDEEDEILGISKDDRYIFLDPKVHGGSYRKPKI